MSNETKYFIRISQNYATHNSAQKQVSLLVPELNNILITGADQFKTFMVNLHAKVSEINISNKRCGDVRFNLYDLDKMHNYIPGVSFNWDSPAGYGLSAEGCFHASVHIVKKEL